jgi:tetratricopeptide (TPR) repeat protein
MQDFRYKAFVSYSWSDAAWGKWLLREIETYRTPTALIGKVSLQGEVPARLHPLFKDREEEAAGASIGAAVEAALATSEFLMVICSPRSAQSQWVNREIAWFKTHRNPDKILALIVDGEPGGGELECFPKALTHQVLPDLTISDTPVDAPLAADARISGDGKRKAKLKIAAAMLGVGLDELVNRDEARRTLRTRLVIGASLALATVMSGMAWFAIQARNEADHQRAEADGLVEFMLTDLREKLEPVGRLDALDVVGQRALKYYAGQKPGSLDADALGRRARALHLVGEVRNIRGDTGAALIAFQQAAASTAEQLARDPDNAQRIFDHAQSVFWVGYAASLHGDQKGTEAEFREYKRLAEQLVAIDPNDPKWLMEKSYAETNLGTIFFEQSRYPEAAAAFATAVAVKERVVALQPRDSGSRIELGNSLNWLAQTRAKMGELKLATDLHHREIALYRKILAEDPQNTTANYEEALTWQYLSNLKFKSGQTGEALSDIDTSIAKFRVLVALEARNSEWLEGQVRAQIMRANIMSWKGSLQEGEAMIAAALSTLARLQASDPKNTSWSAMLPASLDTIQARIAFIENDYTGAQRFALAGLARLTPDDVSLHEENINLAVDARLLAGDAEAATGNRAVARDHWTKAIRLMSSVTNPTPYQEANRFIALKRLGRSAEAAAIARELDRQGYRHPAYLRAKSA